jgi:hypothetical protein
MARAFRDVLEGSPSEAAQGLLEIARTAKRERIGLPPGRSYSTVDMGRLLRSRTSRGQTLWSWTR